MLNRVAPAQVGIAVSNTATRSNGFDRDAYGTSCQGSDPVSGQPEGTVELWQDTVRCSLRGQTAKSKVRALILVPNGADIKLIQ
jgi:hypothetical protein